MEAVKIHSASIGYIKKPTEKVMLHSVYLDPFNIRYIKKPTYDVKKKAVSSNNKLGFKVIEYIKNPSEQIQLISVESNPFSLYFIKHPTEKVKKKVIEILSNYDRLESIMMLIKKPSDELIKLILTNFETSILLFNNLSLDVIEFYIKTYKNPSLYRKYFNFDYFKKYKNKSKIVETFYYELIIQGGNTKLLSKKELNSKGYKRALANLHL